MSAAPMPNRLVTIFTSLGCETSLGMGGLPFSKSLPAIAIEDARDQIRLQLVMEVIIDLNGGRPAAGPDALDFFKRKDASRRNALVPDAQLLLETLVDIVAATQHATDVGAHLHVVSACRFETEHGVVAGHIADIEFGDADRSEEH